MGLMELILTVCSIAHPGHCDVRHLQFASQSSLQACVQNAEPYMARWSGDHPKYRIVKWRCAYTGEDQQSL